MAKESTRKKVQGAASATAAGLGLGGLAARGTGYVLKPKPAAVHANKLGVGLLTGGAVIGSANGVYAGLDQLREAKKEEKVLKSAFGVIEKYDDMESKRDVAALTHQKILGQRAYKEALESGRFIREGHDPDYRPAVQQKAKPAFVPKSLPKSGGIDPEKRRQTRMKAEQYGAAGGAAVAAGAAGVQGVRAQRSLKESRIQRERGKGLITRALGNEKASRAASQQAEAMATYTPNFDRFKGKNAKLKQYHLNSIEQTKARAVERNTASARQWKAAARTARSSGTHLTHAKARGKAALALGAGAAGLAAASGGMAYMRRRQGREYTDWWDG